MGTTAEEAKALYAQRGRGDWEADSVLAVVMAAQELVYLELCRALRREERRRTGLKGSKPKPLPPWVREAMVLGVFGQLAATGPTTEFLRLSTEQEFLHIVVELCQSGSVEEWLAAKEPTERTTVLDWLRPHVAKMHDERKPGDRPELRAFYMGVRVWFLFQGYGEPKPGEVRLLAAARGVEPIDTSLEQSRRLWENRVRRWSRAMDASAPDWRAAVGVSTAP